MPRRHTIGSTSCQQAQLIKSKIQQLQQEQQKEEAEAQELGELGRRVSVADLANKCLHESTVARELLREQNVAFSDDKIVRYFSFLPPEKRLIDSPKDLRSSSSICIIRM